MTASELLHEFNAKYGGYVCIDEVICKEFINEMPENFHTVDNLYDWVISQDMAYEIVE